MSSPKHTTAAVHSLLAERRNSAPTAASRWTSAQPCSSITCAQWLWGLSVLGVFIVSFLLDGVSSGAAMYLTPKSAGAQPGGAPPPWGAPLQPDLGYQVIPYVPSLADGPVKIPTSLLTVYMVAVLFVGMLFNGRAGFLAFVRFCATDALLLAFRSVVIIATSLTNPDPMCATCSAPACPPTLLGCIWLTIIRYPFVTCGDLSMSGHTIHAVLMALIMGQFYSGALSRLLQLGSWLVTGVVVVLLLAARFHYSNDVLFAWLLTVLVWFYLNNVETALAQNTRLTLWQRFSLWLAVPPADDATETTTSDDTA